MIITTLVLSLLLSFLPLVIATFCLRYAANVFSRGILGLSAVSFLLGLAQFSLLLGLSYRLFSPGQHAQAAFAFQCVTIAGGSLMIVAGLLWIAYFRTLIKEKAAATQDALTPLEAEIAEKPMPETASATAPEILPAPRKRRPRPAPDWFADDLAAAPVLRLAAEVSAGKRPRRARNRSRKDMPAQSSFSLV